MKKSVAKILRKAASESLEFPDTASVKKRYKKMKKAWLVNVKNGKQLKSK